MRMRYSKNYISRFMIHVNNQVFSSWFHAGIYFCRENMIYIFAYIFCTFWKCAHISTCFCCSTQCIRNLAKCGTCKQCPDPCSVPKMETRQICKLAKCSPPKGAGVLLVVTEGLHNLPQLIAKEVRLVSCQLCVCLHTSLISCM